MLLFSSFSNLKRFHVIDFFLCNFLSFSKFLSELSIFPSARLHMAEKNFVSNWLLSQSFPINLPEPTLWDQRSEFLFCRNEVSCYQKFCLKVFKFVWKKFNFVLSKSTVDFGILRFLRRQLILSKI